MGAYLSLHNNTDDVIMVKLTANTAVFLPIVSSLATVVAGAITILTAGAAATLFFIGDLAITGIMAGAASGVALTGVTGVAGATTKALESRYKSGGFTKVLPGKTWKGPYQTLSLNQRVWLIRLDPNKSKTSLAVRTADSSVFTGATKDSNNVYKAADTYYFKWKPMDLSHSGVAQELHAAAATIADVAGDWNASQYRCRCRGHILSTV